MSVTARAAEPIRRGPITLGLMLTTTMVALDLTVVNVSLAHMQGTLSASPEQITWVLTSFMVAQAAMTPISGWLAARLGLKTMLLTCVALFTLTSVLCGAATDLPQMVLLRALQGLTGAPLLPLSQTALLDISPPEKVGRSMALYSMAAVLAPIVGPVVGGVLTDQLSWRWCFYINLPAGVIGFILLWVALPKVASKARPFDFLGFAALALAVGSLQLMLDRGPSQDWFGSAEIWTYALISGCGFWVWLAHSMTAKNPLFHPDLLKDRNFVTGTAVYIVLALLMFASIALLPLMMQGVLGYPVVLSGMLSAPRGLVVMVLLQLAGRFDAMVDRRLMIAVGLSLFAASFFMMSRFTLDMAPSNLVVAMMVQGAGQGLLSVPLTTVMFATLRPDLRGEGSSINNLMRMMGGSAGIATMQAVTIFNGQRMHASLAGHVSPDDPVVRWSLADLWPLHAEGAMRLNEEITRQAQMSAYVGDYRVMSFLALAAIPLLLLIRVKAPRRQA